MELRRLPIPFPILTDAASTVIGGTVRDGDKDVDPEAINSDGRIEILFR